LQFLKISENNEEHKKEDSIKLLECSIRSLKLEMQKKKPVSFSTYQKRKFFSYLFANYKLTMLTTSASDPDHWRFVYVREARIPRTWDTRFRWLKVFELMFCTKVICLFKYTYIHPTYLMTLIGQAR
jgi:hypothetical protein